MNCSEAERMVSPYIKRTLSVTETEDFLDHIETCSACRDELETYFIVDRALEQLNEEGNASMDFRTLLDQDLKKTRNRITIWRIRRTILILAALVIMTGSVGAVAWLVFGSL